MNIRARLSTSILLAAVVVSVLPAHPAPAAKGCGPIRAEAREPTATSPNDPLFERQWNLSQIKAPEAWELGARGQGTVIAVIDSGIDIAHPDLRSKIVLPRGVTCRSVMDELGHGTHVAGIAAASSDNGLGIAGVAPDAKVMPILGISDGDKIRMAVENGADVINMSWKSIYVSPVDPFRPEFVEAIEYAWEKGVVLVAAAGNDRLPHCDHPASLPHVICVAGTDSRGLPAHFSNQPSKLEGVSLRAPAGAGIGGCDAGQDVWSTMLPGSSFESCRRFRGYEPLGGTSMAAPHVAGVAALLVGLGASNEEIVRCLTSTAYDPLTGRRGEHGPIYGYGIVDAAEAVRACKRN